jgi:hypothetical protein
MFCDFNKYVFIVFLYLTSWNNLRVLIYYVAISTTIKVLTYYI